MSQRPFQPQWTATSDPVETQDARSESSSASERERKAYLDHLKEMIASGTYRVSADHLAAKLVRRLQWW